MNLAFFLEDLFGRRVDLLTPEGISHRIRSCVEKRWYGLIKTIPSFWAYPGQLRWSIWPLSGFILVSKMVLS